MNIIRPTSSLTLRASFIAKEMPGHLEMEKTEQIDLLNRSVEVL